MDDVTNPDTPEVTADDAEDFEAFEAGVDNNDDGDDTPELEEADTPDDDPEPADDGEDIEVDGVKHRIPKALKDKFLMHADYTRKTQAVAQERQALEAERSEFRQLSQAELTAQATVIAIDQSIAEYNQIDWDAWEDQDPMAANKAWRQFQQLQLRRNTAVEQFGQARQQRTLQEQQAAAERLQQGQAELVQKIPGWNEEKARTLLDFGQKQYGFTRQELDGIDDPRVVVALHEAQQFHQMQAKMKQRAKVDAVQAVRPATTLRGNSGRTGVKPTTTDFAAFERLANKKT